IVRSTLPLTDEQADLVRVFDSDDPFLDAYATDRYAFTWTELRDHLARRPSGRITYERSGSFVDSERRPGHDDALEPLPTWRRKVQRFRPIDMTSDERCGEFR